MSQTSNRNEPGKRYCNSLAKARGLDPGRHAHGFKDAIVVEKPLPWRYDTMQNAVPLPQEVINLLQVWLRAYHNGKGYPHLPMAIATDPKYSCPGFRRVMPFTRPAGLMARLDEVEYLVPENEAGPLIWSLYRDRDRLPEYERYRQPEQERTGGDILVCAHGTVDVACAKFGYPLYRFMRDRFSAMQRRIWRVTHFGGHFFAPTFIDLPTGHYWAYVDEAKAIQIIRRDQADDPQWSGFAHALYGDKCGSGAHCDCTSRDQPQA